MTGDGAFVSDHVSCDGSHPYAGVAVASTPDSAELQEMLARHVRDGAKLAVIHRELERKSGRPLSYKLLQSRVLRETLDSAAVGDDNAAFVMAVSRDDGFTVSKWSIDRPALDRAHSRGPKTTRASKKPRTSGHSAPAESRQGEPPEASPLRSALLVLTLGGTNWVVPAGFVDTEWSALPAVRDALPMPSHSPSPCHPHSPPLVATQHARCGPRHPAPHVFAWVLVQDACEGHSLPHALSFAPG